MMKNVEYKMSEEDEGEKKLNGEMTCKLIEGFKFLENTSMMEEYLELEDIK